MEAVFYALAAWLGIGLVSGIKYWCENCTGYNAPDGLGAIFAGLPVVGCMMAGPFGFLLWRD